MTMKIPLTDLKKQIAPIREEIDAAVKHVIDNTNFILGHQVGDFELEAARYCNVRYAIGVSNGTNALTLALIATGVKSGEGVICPAFTYYATAGAIVSIGAVPVIADIDPLTYNISPLKIEEILKKKRRLKIKAIIPVHLYGQCADMDNILRIAKKYKLKVIEDTAQSFGAEYLTAGRKVKSRKAGTIGDCGAVSFFPAKNLGAFGDAGMILTHNKATANMLKLLRNQGNKQKYNHLVIGFNNRLDTLQAAVLQVKIKHLDDWNKKRQANAEYFNRNLKGLNLKTPFVAGYSSHVYHQYVLRLNGPRAKLMAHLRKKGIDSRIYYPLPLHLQKCFAYLGYKKGDFPESEKASREVLAIPVYPDLTKRELDYIITSISGYFYD